MWIIFLFILDSQNSAVSIKNFKLVNYISRFN